jgi:hypothetical protein
MLEVVLGPDLTELENRGNSTSLVICVYIK